MNPISMEKAKEWAKEFLNWLLDEQGNPKQDLIDYAYELDFEDSNYWICIYVNYEIEAPPEYENYWEGLCTYFELMYNDNNGGSSTSCYGCGLDDIATEIYQISKERVEI